MVVAWEGWEDFLLRIGANLIHMLDASCKCKIVIRNNTKYYE
jgi:hypothetical protein